jgi:hypothetical protein
MFGSPSLSGVVAVVILSAGIALLVFGILGAIFAHFSKDYRDFWDPASKDYGKLWGDVSPLTRWIIITAIIAWFAQEWLRK